MTLEAKTVWKGPIPGDLRVVFHRLSRKDIPAYIVGPAVRDALMNETMDKVQRVDLIALAPSIQAVEKVLDGASTSNLFIGRPDRIRRNTSAFAVREGEEGETVRRLVISTVPTPAGVRDELLKREVTVNAIAMDSKGGVVDPYNGVPDLETRRIRTILPPAATFGQKPLFLVKVAKHVAYHGFDADDETEYQAARQALNMLDVPMERARPELERLLINLFPDQGLDFLQRTGVLRFLLPEVQAMVGFDDSCDVHHKDIWAHSRQVVLKSKPSTAVRWAALLHDIGKVWTRSVDEDRRVHFLRHEDMSALLFKGIAARFGLEERLAERIRFLIQNHSRVNMYNREWTDSAVRRLARETGDYLQDLLLLSRADITSKQERRVEELTGLLDELEARLTRLAQEDSREPALPKGAGQIIMDHFGLPPGPVVGKLKEALEAAIEEGRLPRGLPVESYMGFLQDLIRSSSS